MNRKTIFIIGAVILVLVLGYFFLWMKPGFIDYRPQNNIMAGKISQSANTISNWKTYTNTKYDYQVKYLADWPMEIDGVQVWRDWVSHPELGDTIMFFNTNTEPDGQIGRIIISISVVENPKKLSLRNLYIEQAKNHFYYGAEPKFDNLEETTFKGLPALKIKNNSGEVGSLEVAKDKLIYTFNLNVDNFSKGEFHMPPEQIFQAMLDSFTLN